MAPLPRSDRELFLPHISRLRLKCDGTRAETRFSIWAKRTSPFKSARWSGQSTTRAVRITLQGLYCSCEPVLQSCDAYSLPIPFSCFPFTSSPCVALCHHISNAVYYWPPLGVFALNSLYLYSDTAPLCQLFFRLAQAIFGSNLFPYQYPKNLIPVILPAYTAYENGTECSETSAYKIQTPGNHPKESIQDINKYFPFLYEPSHCAIHQWYILTPS